MSPQGTSNMKQKSKVRAIPGSQSFPNPLGVPRASCSVPLGAHIADLSAPREEQDFRAGEHRACPCSCREDEGPLQPAPCPVSEQHRESFLCFLLQAGIRPQETFKSLKPKVSVPVVTQLSTMYSPLVHHLTAQPLLKLTF